MESVRFAPGAHLAILPFRVAANRSSILADRPPRIARRGGTGMKLPRRQFLHLAAGAVALPAVSRIAWAQAYPSRPVRIVVPYGAGTSPDIIARLVGQALSERLGQQLIIENRPGAGGNIGTEVVVRAPADGYTLLLATGANATNAALYEKLNFDFIRDIAPVAALGGAALVMVINPSFPAKTVPGLLPMPRPIQARSTWPRPAAGPRCTSRPNCSR